MDWQWGDDEYAAWQRFASYNTQSATRDLLRKQGKSVEETNALMKALLETNQQLLQKQESVLKKQEAAQTKTVTCPVCREKWNRKYDYLEEKMSCPKCRLNFVWSFEYGRHVNEITTRDRKIAELEIRAQQHHSEKSAKSKCPKCGSALRTERAKQCFDCGASWRDCTTEEISVPNPWESLTFDQLSALTKLISAIDELRTATEYFIRRGQKVVGPYSVAVIKNNISSGNIRGNDEVSAQKEGPWHSIESIESVSASLFIRRGQKVVGPYSAAVIKISISSGNIRGNDEVSAQKEGPWHSIESIESVSASLFSGSLFSG